MTCVDVSGREPGFTVACVQAGLCVRSRGRRTCQDETMGGQQRSACHPVFTPLELCTHLHLMSFTCARHQAASSPLRSMSSS